MNHFFVNVVAEIVFFAMIVPPREGPVTSVSNPCVFTVGSCGGDDCAEKHVTKKLNCGHEGCNFRESGCLICKNEYDAKAETDAVKDDIGTIKSILGKIESTSVKAALESIIADQDGKKRKRNDD